MTIVSGQQSHGVLYDTLLAELAAGVHWGPAWRAIMLAKSPPVAEALLRGESVPVAALDQSFIRRFGWRR